MQPKVNGNAWINATRTGTLPVRLYDFAPHYLSAITIGLASCLVVLESLWLWRGNHAYRELHHYRSTIFGVNLAMRGRFRIGYGLSVRHQLELSLRVRRALSSK
jgi:hypothetical protein